MRLYQFVFQFLSKASHSSWKRCCRLISVFILKGYNVSYGRGLISNGLPKIKTFPRSKFHIGKNFYMNNGKNFNMIGRQQQCYFVVLNDAHLQIGNNVGMSSTAIFCTLKITIGDYVKFGGNTCIYDTDFHSLDYLHRQSRSTDLANAKSKEVCLGNNVFIGAHSTILKGVNIGDNSIIGACSVVTKSIPSNEIWAGNPAKFIKNV